MIAIRETPPSPPENALRLRLMLNGILLEAFLLGLAVGTLCSWPQFPAGQKYWAWLIGISIGIVMFAVSWLATRMIRRLIAARAIEVYRDS